jgi:hypothetical protein
MLVVVIKGRRPGSLLRLRIDLHQAHEVADSRQHLTRYLADGAIGRQCHAERAPITVLDDRFVAVEVQDDRERARIVGRRQRARLPATHGQT